MLGANKYILTHEQGHRSMFLFGGKTESILANTGNTRHWEKATLHAAAKVLHRLQASTRQR
jgi:hypothetical protein